MPKLCRRTRNILSERLKWAEEKQICFFSASFFEQCNEMSENTNIPTKCINNFLKKYAKMKLNGMGEIFFVSDRVSKRYFLVPIKIQN